MGSYQRSSYKSLVACLLISSAASADTFTYTPKFKAADELKMALEPFVTDEGKLKVSQNQLIITEASSDKIEEIKAFLPEIDKGARQLSVQVRNGKTMTVFEDKETYIATPKGGFDAVLRVRGEVVVLDLFQRVSRERKNGIAHTYNALQTSVTGQLNEWIDLGKVASSGDVSVQVRLIK